MYSRQILLLAVLLATQLSGHAAGPATQVTYQSVLGQLAGQIRGDAVRDRRSDREDRRGNRRKRDRNEDRWDNRRDRRDDRIDDRRDERWERYWRYRIGLRLLSLPARHTRVVVGPTVYYYSDGVYLQKTGSAYVVVRSPVGARVRALPYGFRSFYLGPRRYFYVNSTYYVYAPDAKDYVVVEAPDGADAAVEESIPTPIVYPASGQTQDQVDQDRFECHEWATDESGFDPVASGQGASDQQDRYNRALTACLEGRGYSVQ